MKRNWNEYCGDKDLWDMYTHVEVSLEDKILGKYPITSIKREEKGITINTHSGNFVYCDETGDPSILKSGGYTLTLKNVL